MSDRQGLCHLSDDLAGSQTEPELGDIPGTAPNVNHTHQEPIRKKAPDQDEATHTVLRRRRNGRRASRDRMVKPQPHGALNVQMRASDSLVGQLPRCHDRHHGVGGASVGTGLRAEHPCRRGFSSTATAPIYRDILSGCEAFKPWRHRQHWAKCPPERTQVSPTGASPSNPCSTTGMSTDHSAWGGSWQVIHYTHSRPDGYRTVGVENRPMSPNSSCSRVRVLPTTTVASGLKTMLRSSLSP